MKGSDKGQPATSTFRKTQIQCLETRRLSEHNIIIIITGWKQTLMLGEGLEVVRFKT